MYRPELSQDPTLYFYNVDPVLYRPDDDPVLYRPDDDPVLYKDTDNINKNILLAYPPGLPTPVQFTAPSSIINKNNSVLNTSNLPMMKQNGKKNQDNNVTNNEYNILHNIYESDDDLDPCLRAIRQDSDLKKKNYKYKNSKSPLSKSPNGKFVDYRKKQNIYCVNCGEKGHIVKECFAPITSYGIISFKINKNEDDDKYDKNEKLNSILRSEFICDKKEEYPKIKFLMIQRKDTIGYIDFIRGKYTDLNTCISEMTKNEKLNILTKTFDELWNDLWICNRTSENFYRQEYFVAKSKFNKLDIPSIINSVDSKYLFQEFGFAKGRRNIREGNIDCAEREFFEETQYNKESYQFIKNYPTIEEMFTGTNGIVYKHVYYLVKMNDDIKPPCVNVNNKTQLGEVQNLGWFTYDECLHLIRPYDVEKKKILTNVYKDILNMNGQYECSKYYYKSIN